MGILNIDLNNINLDNDFHEDDPDTNTLIRLLVWHTKFEKRKALKKELNEELMEIVWHSKRCWNFSMSEDKKKNRTNFYWVMLLVCIKFESIKIFCHLL